MYEYAAAPRLKLHAASCEQASGSFPKDIANQVRSDESLVPKGDKKAMQRVMPFLQFVAAEVRTQQARRIPTAHELIVVPGLDR